jgi:hypothetical protein
MRRFNILLSRKEFFFRILIHLLYWDIYLIITNTKVLIFLILGFYIAILASGQIISCILFYIVNNILLFLLHLYKKGSRKVHFKIDE